MVQRFVNSKRRRKPAVKNLACAVSAMPFVAGIAAAQEADTYQEAGAVLEEVIVTAQKRQQTLQQTAMSIKVLSGADLELSGAIQFEDYAVSVPNLAFGYTVSGLHAARSISIRGVQGEEATGFYIDDTPVPESIDPRALHVERIEVLRGPQGTLYGARSMGGAVRIISIQPDLDETFGTLHASTSHVFQGDENYLVDGSFNLPVAKNMAVLAAGFYESESGVFERRIVPPSSEPEQTWQNVDDQLAYGANVTTRIEVQPSFVITPRIMHQHVESDGLPYADIDPDNFVQFTPFPIQENGEETWTNFSVTANWSTRYGEFVSATSWFERETFDSEDTSTLIEFFFGTPLSSRMTKELKFERFTQELRFASDFDGPLQVIGGLFFQETEFDNIFPETLVVGLDQLIGGVFGSDNLFSWVQQTDPTEWAVFGEAYFNVTDNLKLVGGLRWFDTEVVFDQVADGIVNGGLTVDSGTQSEDGINPKIAIEYAPSDRMLVYASAAKGFRIGGVNGRVPEDICGPDLAELGLTNEDVTTFESDELWSYELGVKSTLAGGKVQVNAAAYHIDWDNIQQRNRLACGTAFIGNAGAADSNGFEVELTARPHPQFQFSVGVGHIDATITESRPTLGVEVGDRVFQVPDWTANAAVDFEFQILGLSSYLHADAQYIGESWSGNQNTATPRLRPSYSLVNAKFGFTAGADMDIDTALFVRNAFNERANLADNVSLGAEDPRRPRFATNRPRTIGIEVRKRF